MTTKVVPFSFESSDVRVIERDGETWFVLSDVCAVLEISKHRDAASRLDDDERGSVVVDTLGGPQQTTTINESGLYSLILNSRVPTAKKFKRWITHEVLPSIRKTGSYGHQASTTPTVRLGLRRELRMLLKDIDRSQTMFTRDALYQAITDISRDLGVETPQKSLLTERLDGQQRLPGVE